MLLRATILLVALVVPCKAGLNATVDAAELMQQPHSDDSSTVVASDIVTNMSTTVSGFAGYAGRLLAEEKKPKRKFCNTSAYGLKGDYAYEACGAFCKQAKAVNHCKVRARRHARRPRARERLPVPVPPPTPTPTHPRPLARAAVLQVPQLRILHQREPVEGAAAEEEGRRGGRRSSKRQDGQEGRQEGGEEGDEEGHEEAHEGWCSPAAPVAPERAGETGAADGLVAARARVVLCAPLLLLLPSVLAPTVQPPYRVRTGARAAFV